jgi:hypothetical protein
MGVLICLIEPDPLTLRLNPVLPRAGVDVSVEGTWTDGNT